MDWTSRTLRPIESNSAVSFKNRQPRLSLRMVGQVPQPVRPALQGVQKGALRARQVGDLPRNLAVNKSVTQLKSCCKRFVITSSVGVCFNVSISARSAV